VSPPLRSPSHQIVKVFAVSALCAFLLGAVPRHSHISAAGPKIPVAIPTLAATTTASPVPNVWTVETTRDYDVYSNGLRIENRYATSNHPRSYRAFPLRSGSADRADLRTDPAGIVFHTTESLQAPFDASQNAVLKRVSESLAEYVRRRRAYNFLIDRFGRVYRIVREDHAANHAGHSIWADDSSVYIDLNDSFLGVSFEAETAVLPGAEKVNPAQVRAGAILTEMLRSRYQIPARNCVTHAQVSVNPTNFRIGYHTDWASSFPFQRLGLPDNYTLSLPAITLFAFTYDSTFFEHAGDRLAAAAQQSPQPPREPSRRWYHQLAHARTLPQPSAE